MLLRKGSQNISRSQQRSQSLKFEETAGVPVNKKKSLESEKFLETDICDCVAQWNN